MLNRGLVETEGGGDCRDLLRQEGRPSRPFAGGLAFSRSRSRSRKRCRIEDRVNDVLNREVKKSRDRVGCQLAEKLIRRQAGGLDQSVDERCNLARRELPNRGARTGVEQDRVEGSRNWARDGLNLAHRKTKGGGELRDLPCRESRRSLAFDGVRDVAQFGGRGGVADGAAQATGRRVRSLDIPRGIGNGVGLQCD